MPVLQAFKAAYQTAVALSGTAAGTTPTPLPDCGESVLIYNATAAAVACDVQAATFAATIGSPTIVPPGSRHLLTAPRGPLFASAIGTASATGNVYFSRGDGSTY